MSIIPFCEAADPFVNKPTIAIPEGAVDCHAHVFSSRYPYCETRTYTPPDASVGAYLHLHQQLGIRHGVLVQPSVYGNDNQLHLDTLRYLRQQGYDYKGVAVVDADVSEQTLDELLTQALLLNASVDEIVAAVGSSKLVFICNPNNPTGSLTPLDKVKAIATALAGKALVIVDEAYIEFCPEQSATKLINEFSNIVVLRTLSKAFALAGLRTGFTLAQASVLAPIRKVIAPYPVSGVVASIAAQAIAPDAITSMRRQVSILNSLKLKLIEWLNASPAVLKILTGEGNFVTLKLADKNSFKVALEQGLVMRAFTLYGEDDWLRISIGSEQELEQVKIWLDGLTTPTALSQQEVS